MKYKVLYLELLEKAFRNHHIDCQITENTLFFPQQYIEATLEFFDRTSSMLMVQMDVTFSIGLAKHIVESVAGFGNTPEEAMENAWKNFINNCFHPILGAFFTNEFDDQIIREEKMIGGQSYEVVRNHLGIRGKLPENFHDEWLHQFEEDLAEYQFPVGIHWFRFYYAQHQQQTSVCEVLYDNYVWKEMQERALSYNYCPGDDFYSARVLYIAQSKPDIKRMARIIALAQDEEAALIEYGLSPLDAAKAYLFIQHAFGQVLIKRILNRCSFSNQAIINDGENQHIVPLNNEFFYREALSLGETIFKEGNSRDIELLKSIGISSAEFNALNNALKEGASLEGLEGASFADARMEIPGYTCC
ncbi:DUF6348 family protein [Bacteroides sp. 519]|uniref:DUF6348 family protein n=1 Tax=Bacteroides sp. 519 TaxID=2302937 RepID=UPI0013D73F00|nr:DUF6348 family protein [Bacteroides sp. 519]